MAQMTVRTAAGPPPIATDTARRLPQVVPLRGIPVVVAVIGGLVAAIATNRLWALDFFHVAGGGLWTGVDLFVGFVVGPIIGRLSVPAPLRGPGAR